MSTIPTISMFEFEPVENFDMFNDLTLNPNDDIMPNLLLTSRFPSTDQPTTRPTVYNYRDTEFGVLNSDTLKIPLIYIVLNEWDEDGDSYYGGGLPDSFSKDEMPQKFNDEEETGEKVFIVFEKNCQVNCVCKSKETAIKKSDKIYGFFEQWTLLD